MSDPRDVYQAQMKSDIYGAWNGGARDVLAVLPTGGGKSVIVSGVNADFVNQNRKGVNIAHRNELVAQLSGHIASRGIPHRIIAPQETIRRIVGQHRDNFGKSFVNPDAITSVAGIDTLVARKDQLAKWAAQQHYWVTDEAHHLLRGNKWGSGVQMFPNALGLGVTASPVRADGAGLGRHADGVFDHMVLGPTQRELINMGALSDYELVIAEADLEMTDDDIAPGGDYSPTKLKAKAKQSHIVGDVVTTYCKYALGKRTIVFATDVETASDIAKQFKIFGISAASVSAKSESAYRDKVVAQFKTGEITVLINVDLFGEGFDVPACECVIMARPTASLSLYLQQFGRALRLFPGKLYGLVIDMVGNWKRHGFPDRNHVWTLDRREKRSKSVRSPDDLTACPGCGKAHELFHPRCPYCGYLPDPADSVRRSIQQIHGNLILLDREVLQQMRAATELEAPAVVGNQAHFAAGPAAGNAATKRQIEKIAAQTALKDSIAQWAAIQRVKGRDDAESYKRFFFLTGMDVLTALNKERTAAEFSATAELVKEAWAQ